MPACADLGVALSLNPALCQLSILCNRVSKPHQSNGVCVFFAPCAAVLATYNLGALRPAMLVLPLKALCEEKVRCRSRQGAAAVRAALWLVMSSVWQAPGWASPCNLHALASRVQAAHLEYLLEPTGLKVKRLYGPHGGYQLDPDTGGCTRNSMHAQAAEQHLSTAWTSDSKVGLLAAAVAAPAARVSCVHNAYDTLLAGCAPREGVLAAAVQAWWSASSKRPTHLSSP